MMPTLTSTKIVRLVLVPLLSIWVAGGGCLIGCQGMVATAATVSSSTPEKHSGRKSTIVAAGSACASSGSHSCCAKNTAKATSAAKRTDPAETTLDTVSGSSSGMMKGCPLAVGKAALTAKVRDNEVAAAPVVTNSILPADNVLERTSPLSPPTRLPNRGHTYLRCCVFLI
jgi:hypothetical protein